MITEKLYYKDAYIKEFSATVKVCEAQGEKFVAVLDKTAFFPEEGGQSADSGTVDGISVIDVRERGGVIYHYLMSPVEVGKTVFCRLDFAERFDKMQCHTAEHILSGIMHSEFGVENTGFHLGHEDVTFDTSRPMSAEELSHIERLANIAVQRNLPVTTLFPSAKELREMTYRSKLDLTENVRIVNIGDVDSCACCAPHVAYTGEIGLIKLIDSVKHKGGSRIRMAAGMRAYEYVSRVMKEASAVSEMLSAPVTGIAAETENMLAKKDALGFKLSALTSDMAKMIAEGTEPTEGNAVLYCPSLDADAARTLVNIAAERVGGTLVVLFGTEGDLKYVLHTVSPDFQSVVKTANAALMGKGGGKAPMAQGSYRAPLGEIYKFFA
ncbi:MAG: hypothetical protein IKD45_00520 [Clostridia bacterium]|nr:hypothetical protein [Clostridia bacterium]